MPMSCSFVSRFQKYYLFLCTTIKNAKNCISKYDIITFTLFSGHGTAKNKNVALKSCMHVVCMYLDRIYSVFFLDSLIMLDFIGNYFWKIETLNFGGQNRNKSKIRDCHFVRRTFNFTPFGIFWLRLTSKPNILAVFKHLPFFDPKWRNMTSLNRHFLKKTHFFLKFLWQTSLWCWGSYWKFCFDICCRFGAIEKIR